MAWKDNFDTIKSTAAVVAQSAAKKTRQLISVTKANLAILAEEDKIKKAHTELGKLYYKDFIMEEEPDEAEYLPWCDKITASRKTIEALRAEIDAAKDAGDDYVIVPVDVAYPDEAAETPEAEAAEAAAEDTAEDTASPPAMASFLCPVSANARIVRGTSISETALLKLAHMPGISTGSPS